MSPFLPIQGAPDQPFRIEPAQYRARGQVYEVTHRKSGDFLGFVIASRLARIDPSWSAHYGLTVGNCCVGSARTAFSAAELLWAEHCRRGRGEEKI
jgi:hypothetical protein